MKTNLPDVIGCKLERFPRAGSPAIEKPLSIINFLCIWYFALSTYGPVPIASTITPSKTWLETAQY